MVAAARAEMQQHQQQYAATREPELARQLAALQALKDRQVTQMTLQLDGSSQAEHFKAARKEERLKRIDQIFEDHQNWVRDTLTIEPVPFIQIIAVFTREQD